MNTYSLLVWEEVPENTKLYSIPNDEIDGDKRQMLQTAHGYFVNVSNNPKDADNALDALSKLLDGGWEKYLVYSGNDDKRSEIVGNHTNVYLAGFLM